MLSMPIPFMFCVHVFLSLTFYVYMFASIMRVEYTASRAYGNWLANAFQIFNKQYGISIHFYSLCRRSISTE